MKEAEKKSKGTEYYKGYAAGYRDAMKDFGYILNTLKAPSYAAPLEIPNKGWWESPPLWNPYLITCTSKYVASTGAQQENSKENK